ncbi:MAG: hypothetical protein ACK5M4_02570, partial [Pseudorhodobacter sp.]
MSPRIDPDDLAALMEVERAELARRLGQFRAQVTAGAEHAKETVSPITEMAVTVEKTVRRHPVMTLVGVAALFFGVREWLKPSVKPEASPEVSAKPAGDGKNPLLLGAVGLALGAAMATALPRIAQGTLARDEDALLEEAKKLIAAKRRQAERLAGTANEILTEAARNSLETLS